jgi:hypothetical protein
MNVFNQDQILYLGIALDRLLRVGLLWLAYYFVVYFPNAYFNVLIKKLESLNNFSLKNQLFKTKNVRLGLFE